ncbi:ferredoxin [Trichloromonas sp.]|uniref:ferredoxin n=1 Tax=Trichloromonas sp. TaxID=3069249 RepID=UPI003D81B8BC
MSRKLFVDQDACICCNLCADTVPDVFRMNTEGVAEVYDPLGTSEDVIQEAIDACPVACIHWEN